MDKQLEKAIQEEFENHKSSKTISGLYLATELTEKELLTTFNITGIFTGNMRAITNVMNQNDMFKDLILQSVYNHFSTNRGKITEFTKTLKALKIK